MTAQSSIPLKWYVPFAQGDSSRVELPVTTSDPTRASQTLGFPPLTMQPPESGGVPPQGEDFNGGLNQVARIAWWVLNGGGWPFDSTFASNSNINGYPNGALLQSADFRGQWINTADNNQNNPDTNGTNWVPGFQYGTTALTGLTGGTVTPTPAQAAKSSITLAGTLASALTIVLPTWIKNWTITNSTTGAFVTIVKTAAGSGVTIPQNAAPTRVSGDGTNIVQPAENIATPTTATQAAQLAQTSGRYLGSQLITSSGTYTPGTYNGITATKARFRAAGGGGAGGGVPTTTAAQAAVAAGGQGGGYVEFWITSGLTAQSITIGAGGAPGAAGNNPGGNGGNTIIGTLANIPGGVGGVGSGAGAPPFIALSTNAITVATGTATFQINRPGERATAGIAPNLISVQAGNGGNSPFGTGGAGSGGGNGAGGTGPGVGGGGAGAGASSGSAFVGGPGNAGYVIVDEYA